MGRISMFFDSARLELLDGLIFHVDCVVGPGAGNLLAQRPSINRQSVKMSERVNTQAIRRERVVRN